MIFIDIELILQYQNNHIKRKKKSYKSEKMSKETYKRKLDFYRGMIEIYFTLSKWKYRKVFIVFIVKNEETFFVSI